MGNYIDDKKIEQDFYVKIFKPWIVNRGWNSEWVRDKKMQKDDIDVILTRVNNISIMEKITLSLKTRNVVRNDVFVETVSNCKLVTKGWLYYSLADWIVYSMGNLERGFDSYLFKVKDLLKLSSRLNSYAKKFGKTKDKNNNILYETEGRIIPFSEFPFKVIFTKQKELNTCVKN